MSLTESLSPVAETSVALIIYSGEAGATYFIFSAVGFPVTQIWIGNKTLDLTLMALTLGERCHFIELGGLPKCEFPNIFSKSGHPLLSPQDNSIS